MSGCYIWNLVSESLGSSITTAHTLFTNQAQSIVKLWIQDPAESASITLTPSARSKELTELYWQLGDIPTVTINYSSELISINNITYQEEESIWKISIAPPSDTAGATLTVENSVITVYACKVAARTLKFAFVNQVLLPAWSPTSPSTSPSLFSLLRDSCAPNQYILSNTTSLAYSNDFLQTINGLGAFSLAAFQEHHNLIEAATVNATHIKSPSSCISNYPWLGFSSSSVILPDSSTIPLQGVLDLDVDPFQNLLYILQRINSTLIQLLRVESTGNTILANFTSTSSLALDNGLKGSSPKLTFSSNKNGALLLYGDQVLYSPDFGHIFFPVRLVTRNPASANLQPLEHIYQVATCPSSNNYVIVTSTHRVFVSKLGLQEALEINATSILSQFSSFLLDYSIDGVLSVVGNSASPPYFTSMTIPIESDYSVASWSAPGYSCPYFFFNTNQSSSVTYVIDYGEYAYFQANFDIPANYSGSMSALYPNSSFLQTMMTSTSVFGGGNGHHEYLWNITPADPMVTGTTSMMTPPQYYRLACFDMPVSLVHAGCPEGRAVRVHLSYTQGDCPSVFSVHAGESVNPSTGIARTAAFDVHYDCARYGRPFKVYYGYPFTLTLQLVDAKNNVLRPVVSDFFLIETNGQRTYSYNSTFAHAGCRNSLNMPTNLYSWSRNNYAPCYSGNSIPDGPWQNNPYPILNGTFTNSIRWTSGRDTYYTFRAVVLDPTCSYCNLSVEFGIHVYGAPVDIGVQLGILFGIMGASFAILATSYWWHRKEKLKEREKEKAKEKEN